MTKDSSETDRTWTESRIFSADQQMYYGSKVFEGGVPTAEIRKHLTNWSPVQVPHVVSMPDGSTIADPGKSVIVRPEFDGLPARVLGTHSDGYNTHGGFNPMVTLAENILDDDIKILSAGLLRHGAKFFMQFSRADETTVSGGEKVLPYITMVNALDGSTANTIFTGALRLACTNQIAASIKGAAKVHRVKHSKYSEVRLASTRDALEILTAVETEFDREVQAMLDFKVSDADFEKLLDEVAPAPGKGESGRGATMAENKREKVGDIWWSDNRVSGIEDSLFKFVQTMNTYETHEAIVRKVPREVRNFERVADDYWTKFDTNTVNVAQRTLGRSLVLA